MEFWKILYTHFIRDPKGITYVAFFPQIESHAKMRLPKYTFVKSLNEIILYDCHFGENLILSLERESFIKIPPFLYQELYYASM